MKKKILLPGIVMLCMLTGCGASEEAKETTVSRLSFLTETSGEVSGNVYAPGKLDVKVDGRTVTTSWASVSGATSYECAYEGASSTIEVEKNSFNIKNANEGKVTVKVRCIKDTDEGRLYSEWTKATVEVPYAVGAPGEITASLDGSYITFNWDAGENADNYECIYTTEQGENTFVAKKNTLGLRYANEGITYSVKVRSKRETPNGVIYSDWKQGSYTVPTVQYTDVGFSGAVFYDSEQVVKWAKQKGYSTSTEETKDSDGNTQTVVTVHYKDEANSGFFNSAGRILASALVGFVGGYSEQLESDYSSVQKIIAGYVKAGSLSEYANSFDANATQAGKQGAFAGAVNALLLDTDIYYQYYYSNPSKGADLGTAYFLKNKRENYEANNFGDFKKDSDGSYNLTNTVFNKDYRITVSDVTVNGFAKWAVVTVPQK